MYSENSNNFVYNVFYEKFENSDKIFEMQINFCPIIFFPHHLPHSIIMNFGKWQERNWFINQVFVERLQWPSILNALKMFVKLFSPFYPIEFIVLIWIFPKTLKSSNKSGTNLNDATQRGCSDQKSISSRSISPLTKMNRVHKTKAKHEKKMLRTWWIGWGERKIGRRMRNNFNYNAFFSIYCAKVAFIPGSS